MMVTHWQLDDTSESFNVSGKIQEQRMMKQEITWNVFILSCIILFQWNHTLMMIIAVEVYDAT